MKLYFAHPITAYGTDLEKKIIQDLTAQGFQVVNPDAAEHQQKVKDLRVQYPDRNESSRIIMEYFVSVCNTCDVCAFIGFPDGSLGAGVVKEAQSFLDRQKKVYVVRMENDTAALSEVRSLSGYYCLDVDSTRAALKKFDPKAPKM